MSQVIELIVRAKQSIPMPEPSAGNDVTGQGRAEHDPEMGIKTKVLVGMITGQNYKKQYGKITEVWIFSASQATEVGMPGLTFTFFPLERSFTSWPPLSFCSTQRSTVKGTTSATQKKSNGESLPLFIIVRIKVIQGLAN